VVKQVEMLASPVRNSRHLHNQSLKNPSLPTLSSLQRKTMTKITREVLVAQVQEQEETKISLSLNK
jgi:hypothetical protein